MAEEAEKPQLKILTVETAEKFGVAGEVFLLSDLIGSGSFGSVYRCHREDASATPDANATWGTAASSDAPATASARGEDFAVKVIDARRLAEVLGHPIELVVPRLQREVEILMFLGDHANIVRLRAAYFSQLTHRFYVVTEWVQGGDLFNVIVRRRKPFSEEEACTVFVQLAKAVLFCHERGIAHRDLKLENVLIEDLDTFRVKLCDYGQAKMLQMEGFIDTSQTLTSTPAYTAPEVKAAVAASRPYDAFKLDAFGLGIILYGMMCSALPDAAKGTSYTKHTRWQSMSEHARNLIQGLLHPDPHHRISVRDILQHPWLAKNEDDDSAPERTGSRPPSLAPSTSASTSNSRQKNVDCMIAAQRVLMAIQRERGTCCWAVSEADGDKQMMWQTRATDECFNEVDSLIGSLLDDESASGSHYNPLRSALKKSREAVVKLRQQSATFVLARETTIDAEEDFRDMFQGYSTTVVALTVELMETVVRLMGTATPNCNEQTLRLLQASAEQLGRERAFLCGHLARPETLRISSVVISLSQIIGARKLLLGTADSADVDFIGASTGLSVGLRLGQAPFSEAELERLESAETRVLNARRNNIPPVAEAWHLLTEMVDKVHQHIIVCLAKVLINP